MIYLRSPVGIALATALAVGLGACGSSKSVYPALRDIPPPPAAMTPEAIRESLKSDLSKERAGEAVGTPQPPAGKRQPAVPAKKPDQHSSADMPKDAPQDCGAPRFGQVVAQAIPPLRGTLRGPERLAPEGVTAATETALEEGRMPLRFEPGTADLSAAHREGLRRRAAAFLARGGSEVFIDVRGAPVGTPNAVRSLDRLQLGLRRASVVADYLIAQGVASERIKLLVAEADGGSPAAGPDGALVTFQGE